MELTNRDILDYMRYSQLFGKSVKDYPKDEVSINAKLLLKGGYIDKLMAGSYSLLPLGRRVEQKIEQIIREEMNKTGAQEMLLPLLHPKEIWNETGRWDSAKDVMYQFEKDGKEYALSFTHEEIVMDMLRKHVSSYKDLPIKIYQFSTKFRNEVRAKSGVLREREFVMKDLYSAHISKEDLMEYYWQIADAYLTIFKRIGLDAKITEASGGVFTDEHTHEFQVICDAGEDTIYHKDGWKYHKNKEVMTEEELADPDTTSATAVEVGNIFPLGTMYSQKMNALCTDRDGSKLPIWFGSYGIGPKRVMGTVVEVSHDENGIIWPASIAPFQVHLVGLADSANDVYKQLQDNHIDVLYDDRDVSAGEKFTDADLLGIPYRIVVSAKTGENVEIKKRNEEKVEIVPLAEAVKMINL